MPRMKSVTPSPAVESSGKVVTTTTREVLPSTPGEIAGSKLVQFWPYVEALSPSDWERHTVYIYRVEPKVSAYGDGSSQVEKISAGIMEIQPGQSIAFNDREEIEGAIRQKHGGKVFRFILKRGHERIAEEKCSNELSPRFPYMPAHSPAQSPGMISPGYGPQGTDASAAADVAKTALSTIANQDRAAADTTIRALDAATNVIARMASTERAAPATSQADEMMKSAMLALLQKAMNPPDPFETFAKMMAIMNAGNGGGGEGAAGGSRGGVVDRLLDAAVDRFLSPGAGTASPSAASELVRQLPSVGGYIMQSIAEWRKGAEAQRDTAAIMAGIKPPAAPPAGASPQSLPPTIIAPPAPAAAAAPAQGSQPVGNPSLEFVEMKIMEMLNEGNTAEDTADDVLTFLDRIDNTVISGLLQIGEAGMLNLFQTREILKPATANMPRLTEFIRAFLRLATPKAPDKTPLPN
jgi:hypothetical protein